MSKHIRFSRRKFLATSAIGAAATFAAPAFLRAKNPNEKLNIAVIGCGGRGGHNLEQMSGENVVALCDVNGANAWQSRGSVPRGPAVQRLSPALR